MREKYHVWYITDKHEGVCSPVEFDKLDEVTTFLSQHAANPEFWFWVVQGTKVEFEPCEVIKAYRPKGRSS